MTGKKILALVLAIIIGFVAIKIVVSIMGVIFSLLSWLLWIGVAAVVVYALYRGFVYMLDNGKRLT